MDLCLFGRNNGVPVEDVAAATGLTAEQVNRIFRDIDQKRKITEYLHLRPELVDDVPEISAMAGHAHQATGPHT
jgi:NAD+ synthase